MLHILPAGEHYGSVLRKWESAVFALSEIRYAANSRNPLHANEQALLVFVERGSYVEKTGKADLLCGKDALVFIPAGRQQADVFATTDTTCLVVDFMPSFLERISERGAEIRDVSLFSTADLAGFGAQLLREFKRPDSISALVFESLLLNILVSGFRKCRSSFGPKAPFWLLMARDLLHDRFSESFTMESVAKEVGVHPVHLSHEFRRFFKSTPGEYLRGVRVDFAAKQLTQTDLPLSEIAMASGFADQAHFSRTFRRITHLTPLQFRELARR